MSTKWRHYHVSLNERSFGATGYPGMRSWMELQYGRDGAFLFRQVRASAEVRARFENLPGIHMLTIG